MIMMRLFFYVENNTVIYALQFLENAPLSMIIIKT